MPEDLKNDLEQIKQALAALMKEAGYEGSCCDLASFRQPSLFDRFIQNVRENMMDLIFKSFIQAAMTAGILYFLMKHLK